MAEQTPALGDRDAKWKFWFRALIDCSGDLRATLAVDEASFRLVAPTAFGASSRDYFAYAALDEVQKVAIALLQWTEVLAGDHDDSGSSDQEDRVILASVRDDQRLRIRKLIELLVDAICFSETNEPAYYRHYLLLRELRERRATQIDLNEFYACPSRNLEASVARICAEVAKLEGGSDINLELAWYRNERQALGAARCAELHPAQLLTSTRLRLKRAIRLADPGELLVLGFSYDQLFGQVSQSVHFGPGSHEYRLGVETVAAAIDECAVLGLNVIVRLQRLLDEVPAGINRTIRDQFESNDVPAELVERRTRGTAEVGDFVLAYGDLGEVRDVVESEFGYRSYRVLYLAERPLPEIDEDWFPAQHVQVLFPHAVTVELLAARNARLSEELRRKLAEPGNAYLRASMKEIWERALRDHIHARRGRVPARSAEQLLDDVEDPRPCKGDPTQRRNEGDIEHGWKWWLSRVIVPLLVALVGAAAAICAATDCLAGDNPRGEITFPKDGAEVSAVFMAEGTLSDIPGEQHIWLAVQVGNLLFPKVEIASNQHWLQQAVEAGRPPGGKFSLVLLMVGPEDTRRIEDRLDRGDFSGWEELTGSTKLDAATDLVLLDAADEP
jgi:hypothetical protein